MDYSPLTLLFIFCQLGHLGYVIGKPASDNQAKTSWPQKCVGHHYCTVRPYDYPSESKLRQIYEQQKENVNFTQQVGYNSSDRNKTNICRHSNYIVDNVYMIQDENNNIRYAFHIPGLYNFSVFTTKCRSNANKYLDQEYKDQGYTCIQEISQYQYIVLSQDKKSLETVKIKGLPSACRVLQTQETN